MKEGRKEFKAGYCLYFITQALSYIFGFLKENLDILKLASVTDIRGIKSYFFLVNLFRSYSPGHLY